MTRSTLDPMTILPSLDSATTPADLDVSTDATARSLLTRTLESPTATTELDAAHLRARVRPVRARRVFALGAATILVGAGAVVLPSVIGGPDAAPAAWAAVPHTLSEAEASAAEKSCLEEVRAAPDLAIEASSFRARVTEGRGTSEAVLLTGQDAQGGWELVCIATEGKAHAVMGGGTTAGSPAPQSVSLSVGAHDGANRIVSGTVGTDVKSVMLHTAESGDVTASVADGHALAWWPGAPPAPI